MRVKRGPSYTVAVNSIAADLVNVLGVLFSLGSTMSHALRLQLQFDRMT